MASEPPRSHGERSMLAAATALLIVAGLLIAAANGFLPFFGTVGPSYSGTTVSAGLDSPPALCTDLTPSQELVNSEVLNGSSAGYPGYDEQLWMGLEQNFSSSISYNVTLRAQNDSYGFGPVYLLNGLANSGYWAQVGVGWNLAIASGALHLQGFQFVFEVWDTTNNSPVYPNAEGTTPKAFDAVAGDVVELSLTANLEGLGMSAHDWNTTAEASTFDYGVGATGFSGSTSETTRYPTSLMTEWYHALPFYCSDEPVVYSSSALGVGTAWLRIDEWNITGVPNSQRFNSSDVGQCCILNAGPEAVNFQNSGAFQYLSSDGTTIYADANEFVTP